MKSQKQCWRFEGNLLRSARAFVFILWVSFFGGQAPSSLFAAGGNHTITIDGTNDFAADEDVPGTSGSTWYFTWDAANFYFAVNASDVNSGSSTKWVLLYLDADPRQNTFSGNGTALGQNYNTQHPGLPFNADYHLRWKADNTFTDLMSWNGSSWVGGNNSGVQAFQSGTFVEYKIPRANLGSPAQVYVCGAMINEQGGVESTFFLAPQSNGPEGYDKDFAHYFGFPLADNIAPDFAGNEDTYPVASIATGNYSSGATWTGGAAPHNNSNVFIQNGHTVTLDVSGDAKHLTVISGGTFSGSSNTLNIASNGLLTNNGTFNAGTGTVQFNGAGSINGSIAFNNAKISGGVDFGTSAIVNGILEIMTGSFVNTNPPTYGSNAILSYSPGGSYNASAEWTANASSGAGVPQNVALFNNTTLNLASSNRTMLGDLLINSGSTLISTSGTLTLSGDFTNNGSFTHSSGNVTFNKNGNQTLSGNSTTTFNTLTLNMGTTNSNVLEAQSLIALAGSSNPLVITNGTFKLSSNSTITPFTTGAGATIPASGGFWLNGGTVNAGGFSWALSGLLRVSNGTLGLGTGSGNSLTYFTGSTITIEGGALNIAGRLSPNSNTQTTTYSQSGGTVTAVTVGSGLSTRGGFELTAGSSFAMSNGAIVMQRATSNASGDYLNLAATHNVTGGTLQIGNSGSPDAAVIRLNSTAPIHHLTVDGSAAVATKPTAQLFTNALTVKGNITVQAGTTLNANNLNLNLAGNWTNNGTFTPGTSTVTLDGPSPQTMSGSTFYNLTINNASGITLLTDETVSNTLTLSNGNVSTGANKMIIAAGGTVAHTSGHVVGNLQKHFAGAGAQIFEIGDASNYTPVHLAFASVTTPGNVTASTQAGDHANIASSTLDAAQSVNRNWSLSSDGTLAFTNYDATFNFVSSDLDGGANTSNLAVGKLDGGMWTYPTVGTRTATSTQAIGITSFSAFQLAEPLLAQMTYTVINTNDAGSGSLRQAIIDANAHANLDATTPDLIYFNIPGAGPHTITPTSSLPTITDPVVIDGLTQPGASCASWPPTLKIELNGASAGSGVNGLTITAGNSAVRGLVINRFSSDGIEMSGNGSNSIECNLLGTDVAGTTDLGNTEDGVFVNGVSFNSIGGGVTSRNLISGNNQRGVRLLNATASNNHVLGNYIGTDVNGTADLGNGAAGVLLDGAPDNVIGGGPAYLRNIISGNATFGVDIVNAGASGNHIIGNYIGTDVTGMLPLGNSASGIDIRNGASGNTIGGIAAGATGNVIASNGGVGLNLANAGTGHEVQGNYIGLNASGAALGNAGGGINIFNTSGATIGGVATGARNVISGNSNNGIEIGGTSTNTLVLGNYIGTDPSGTLDLGNNLSGVYINGASNNAIGNATSGAGNVISGNNSLGVRLANNASGNVVQGNFIGTNASGTGAVPNSPNGVEISSGASNNTIGGISAGARNVISGNAVHGVFIIGSTTTGNLVRGNYIGTDVTGALDLGNTLEGVSISGGATNNTVGGTVSGAGNVISGNNSNGVALAIGTSGNFVQGNLIGTDANGTTALPNTLDGVSISSSSNNTIGGETAAARNIISGNGEDGVGISGAGATGNLVQGNYIGTDLNGTSAVSSTVANSQSGVFISASGNTIGGTAPGAGNLISGHRVRGIILFTGSTNNVIRGNRIGTEVSGTAALSNGSNGVELQGASNNIIGGAATGGNTIAFNAEYGIKVVSGSGNAMQRNSIFSNTELGVEIGNDGVTANDAGDGDTGANNLQNFPVLNCAHPSGGNTVVKGALNSTANTQFTLEFFSNAAADASGFGEGETFQLSTTVTTDGTGNVSFTVNLPAALALGQFVSATATDPSNNTSEFSKSIVVTNELLANAGADAEICASGSTTLGGSPAATGGATPYTYSWSPATGLNDASLANPTASPAATTTYILTVTDANGCTAADNVTVTVSALPTVTFNAAGPYCVNAAAIDLTAFVSPSGGTFSGTGVTAAGIFTPSDAGAGTHTITYTFTSGSNCTNSASQNLVVNPLPSVTFNAVSAVCVNASALDLTSYVSPAGGTFSGDGVTAAGIFTPSDAGAGTHTITYSFTDGNSCTNTASQNIVVSSLPTVTFNAAGPYCLNSAAVDLTSFVSPTGGTFSGTGVTAAGIFTPSNAGIGTHTITYSFTDGNSCTNTASQNLMVETLPSVTFNAAGPYCVNAAAIDLTAFVSPSGGTFSGTGVTAAGIFTPSDAGTGTHTITYTFTSGSNCTNSASQNLVVNPLPSVTFSAVSAVCVNAAALDLTSYVSPSGGTFSGDGVTAAGIFTPSDAGVGTHTITYSFTDGNSCTNTASQNLVVNSLPSVTFNPVGPFLVTDAPVNLAGSVSPSGGTFSGPGISGTMFDPSVAGVGTHTVTYSFTDGNSCTNSASQNITVNPVTPVGKAFVFLSNKITLKRTKQSTPSGNMHANGALTIEKGDPSTYNSNLTATGKITIQKDNTINGNVKSPLPITNQGTVNGTITVAAVANEPLPSDSYTAGGPNMTVPSGGSLTLAPGSYGIVTLNNGGTLKLTSGEYRMNELRYPNSAENGVIEINLAGGDPIAIKVVDKLQFGQESVVRLLPNGEDDSELVTFFTLQSSSVTLGRETYLLGNFNAPNAKVTLAKNSQLRGAICAEELLVERDCLFLHHDSPGSLPGPGNLPKAIAGEVEEISDQSSVLSDYALEQNYPNPFNPTTKINFQLPVRSEVRLFIYNIHGQLVRTLVNGEYESGKYEVVWDGKNEAGAQVATGLYVYVFRAGEFVMQRKLILMR